MLQLPASVVAMAYLFPAIIHRVESYLITLEACKGLHLDIRPDLALEAMTKDSDNTDEHNEEQIQFQRGMGKNYERLEFIGDCFLKMATSISLYTQYPDSDEFDFHIRRMCLICNKNLCLNAVKLKLYESIRSLGFSRYVFARTLSLPPLMFFSRSWYPEGLILKRGKTATASKSHDLGDKTIADVCEALIGAALLTGTHTGSMDMAVRAVTELVCSADHVMKTWSQYYEAYNKPAYQTARTTAAQLNLAEQIEKRHAYHFEYPRLLTSAFVHPSYPFSYSKVPCYQRLEFLGDSLLDMASINFLFHAYPDKNPQWLTEHKMAMVSNQFLGALCVHLGFHKHLKYLGSVIAKQIADYVEEINEARLLVEEAALAAGKPATDCARDYWVNSKQPPKCLPDIVEAYIGAIFVDSCYRYEEVERFFDAHVRWFFTDMAVYDTYANKHPTTFLTNFLSINMGCSDYRIFSNVTPDLGDGAPPVVVVAVMVHGVFVADATGKSSRDAKVAASKKALERLERLPITEFRREFKCECRVVEAAEEVLAVDETAD